MTRRVSKGDVRRQEIITLARKALIDFGYDRFSLREIAGQANMKLGNLQYYFPTKETLVEAVVRQEFEANLETLSGIASKASDAEQALRQVAHALVSHWLAEGSRVYAVMSFLALHEESFRVLRDEVYSRFYGALLPFVKAVQPALTVSQQKRRVRVITSLLDGALLQGDGAASASGRPSPFVQDIADAVLAVVRS